MPTRPEATSLRVEARLRYAPADAQPEAGAWSAWRVLGHWGRGGPGAAPLPRSAGDEEEEAPPEGADPVRLAIDALRLSGGGAATAFQVRLTLRGGAATPRVRLLAASTGVRGRPIPPPAEDPPLGRAVTLAVPPRSQRVERAAIAGEICSPTALGMVLQFYGVDQPTEQIAGAVFDHGAEIYGNWPFNVAYAGSLGFQAVVRHFRSMGELERELQQGHPVIITHAFEAGELPESPLTRTKGHLIVVTGVTAAGDFLVNEPAAHPARGEAIARVYSRAHLRPVFLRHGGVGYVITPAAPAPTLETVTHA